MKKKRVGIFTIQEVMEHVFIIQNTFTNMILVEGSKRAILFDIGYGFGRVTDAVRQITDKPLDVVISHGHVDHGGGAWEFEKVYLHPADWPVMERHASSVYRDWAYGIAKKLQRIPFVKVLPKGLKKETFIERPKGNFVAVKEGDVFDLGGITFQVIELPGHTPGSIGLYSLEMKLILLSDAANGFVFLFLEESTDLETYRNSLYKLKELDFEYMIQGHRAEIVSKKELDDYIDVAEHPDWENGKIRKNDMLSGDVLAKVVRSAANPNNKAELVIEESRLKSKSHNQ